jgi:hypothetical protein
VDDDVLPKKVPTSSNNTARCVLDPRLLYLQATDSAAMSNKPSPPPVPPPGVAARVPVVRPLPQAVYDPMIPPNFLWLEARWWGIILLTCFLVAHSPGKMVKMAIVGWVPILLYLAHLENEYIINPIIQFFGCLLLTHKRRIRERVPTTAHLPAQTAAHPAANPSKGQGMYIYNVFPI